MEVTVETEVNAFREWASDLAKELREVSARLILRALAFEFLSRVIARTPVDTGRARGGWASWLLAQGMFKAAGGLQSRRPGKTTSRSGRRRTGVDEGSFKQKFTGREQFILLINAVHYIVDLEYGSSGQAPSGMVRITLREMRMNRFGSKAMREQFQKAVAKTNRKRQRKKQWKKVGPVAAL